MQNKSLDPSGLPVALPRVLHVSCDFPDPIVPAKTPVIRTLVDMTADRFAHRVLSLNRESPDLVSFGLRAIAGLAKPRTKMRVQPFAYGEAAVYEGLSHGLFLAMTLRSLGDWIADRILASGDVPDLLVAHKLSIEGLAVQQAALRLGRPYALSIQGDTDTKVLAARPDLRRRFASVFHEAAMVFPFAPWAMGMVEQRLGARAGPVQSLPCPTDLDEPVAPIPGGEGLLSTFHLKNHRRKNLQGMVMAMKLLNRDTPGACLGVVGGGDEREVKACREVIAGDDRITLEGPLDRAALRERMGRAAAFVCPSLRESFGLVFIEALFAGLPVIYPKGTAIDGFLDGVPFAIAVDARDPRSIAQGMEHAIRHEAKLKAQLAIWQTSEDAARFRRPAIAAAFTQGLHAAMRPACAGVGELALEIRR